MIILYISWRRFQNIWNKKTEPFLKICYHGLKNFQKGFENNSSQEPPITAVLNFSMYSLLSVYLPGKLVNTIFEKELPYFKAALLLHKSAIFFAHSISIFFLNLSHLSCKDQVPTIPPAQFRENMRERGHRSFPQKNVEIYIAPTSTFQCEI